MVLENRGDIVAPFRALPGTGPLARAFTFEPEHGEVPVDESLVIRVDLLSRTLGRFDEKFQFALAGSDAPLELQFKGCVAGPSFSADVESLDFGMVSYGFRCAAAPNCAAATVRCEQP